MVEIFFRKRKEPRSIVSQDLSGCFLPCRCSLSISVQRITQARCLPQRITSDALVSGSRHCDVKFDYLGKLHLPGFSRSCSPLSLLHIGFCNQ